MVAIASKPIVLLFICGFAYAAATLAMKATSETPKLLFLAAIVIFLGAAVLLEIIVLQQMDLGTAYIAIIATESLIIVAIAAALGEGLGPREMAGAGLVLAGTMLIGA